MGTVVFKVMDLVIGIFWVREIARRFSSDCRELREDISAQEQTVGGAGSWGRRPAAWWGKVSPDPMRRSGTVFTQMNRRLLAIALGIAVAGVLGCAATSPQATSPLVAPAPLSSTSAPQSSPGSPSTVVDLLAPKRPRVTDSQLEKLKRLPLEACWGALQGLGYKRCFEGGFILTQPGRKVTGRAVTMRYLPVRPDLVEATRELARNGGWNPAFNIRAGDILERGDLVCVELGGMVERSTFVGDITALAIQERGAAAIVADGGIRDFDEIRQMPIPCYVRGTHASAMEDQVGVEWGEPIRIGGITVLPGDAVLGDAEGILVIPPHLVDPVIEKAEATVAKEEFIREKMRTGKYPASDLYPSPTPELMKELEARKAARSKDRGSKPQEKNQEKKEK